MSVNSARPIETGIDQIDEPRQLAKVLLRQGLNSSAALPRSRQGSPPRLPLAEEGSSEIFRNSRADKNRPVSISKNTMMANIKMVSALTVGLPYPST